MKQTKLQKILLLILYSLIILMIVFSFGAMKNKGKEGYDKCIKEKCEERGDEYCNKFREINNCCAGAGGETTIIEGKVNCDFR